MMHFARSLAALPLALIAFNGWASEEPAVVIMRDMTFHPAEVTVRVGDTVRWENHDRRQFHNVWFKELSEEPGEYLFPEEHLERTFEQAGVYPYVCQPHERRGMTGVVRVVE